MAIEKCLPKNLKSLSFEDYPLITSKGLIFLFNNEYTQDIQLLELNIKNTRISDEFISQVLLIKLSNISN